MSEEELKSEKTAPAGNDQPENDWEKAWDNFKVDMNRFDQSEFEHPGGPQQEEGSRGQDDGDKVGRDGREQSNRDRDGRNKNAGDTDDREDNEDEAPEDKKKSRLSDIISWLIVIAAAIALAIVVNNVVILKTVITSGSMRPTMEIDEHVIANRLAYLFSEPQRGDMVFFANPDDETETYVKRIIGLPGDKVEIKKGKVYINDAEKPLKEPYLFEKAEKLDFGPYYVPEDSYFMLGDNRNISRDSRFWDTPFVKRDKIYGKALFGYRVRKMESAEY